SLLPQPQQFAVEIVQNAVRGRVLKRLPTQHTSLKGGFGLGIRNLPLPCERREFFAAALADGFHQHRVGVADHVLERRHLPVLLSHKQQGNERGKQQGSSRQF